MGNKIKKKIISLFCSLLLAFNFSLFFSEALSLKEEIGLFILFTTFFFLSLYLIKKLNLSLNYILFVSIMPMLLIGLTLFVDTTFFENKIIHNLLKLFSWDFYEGETRSRHITKALLIFILPVLSIINGIFAYFIYHYKRNKTLPNTI